MLSNAPRVRISVTIRQETVTNPRGYPTSSLSLNSNSAQHPHLIRCATSYTQVHPKPLSSPPSSLSLLTTQHSNSSPSTCHKQLSKPFPINNTISPSPHPFLIFSSPTPPLTSTNSTPNLQQNDSKRNQHHSFEPQTPLHPLPSPPLRHSRRGEDLDLRGTVKTQLARQTNHASSSFDGNTAPLPVAL